jgi:nitrite reductase (NADH) small subunit
MMRHVLFLSSELDEAKMRIIDVEGRSIGVVRVRGRYYGIRNVCPHHGAPLCEGIVRGTFVPSRPLEYVYDPDLVKIRCPWHGYEFHLETGRSIADGIGLRVKTYDVCEEQGHVVLYT